MKHLLIIFPLLFSAQREKVPSDALHVYSSAIITNVVGHYVYNKTERIGLSHLAGFGASVTAGLAKEFIWDKALKKGVFSKDDLFFDAWGSMLGQMTLRITIDLKERKRYDYNRIHTTSP